MTVCFVDPIIIIIWLVLSVLVPTVVCFLLNKFTKSKLLSVLIAICLFLVLFFSIQSIDNYFLVCTGPLVDLNGTVIA